MGFSDIAIQVIMFVAVLIAASMVVVFFNGYSRDAVDSANIQRQQLSDRMRTSMNIDMLRYDNSTNPHTTSVYVRNTGRVIISLDSIDVYLDRERIPRNNSNRTIIILSDTDTINVGRWDPKEVLLVQIFKNISSGLTHSFDLMLENGLTEREEFSN